MPCQGCLSVMAVVMALVVVWRRPPLLDPWNALPSPLAIPHVFSHSLLVAQVRKPSIPCLIFCCHAHIWSSRHPVYFLKFSNLFTSLCNQCPESDVYSVGKQSPAPSLPLQSVSHASQRETSKGESGHVSSCSRWSVASHCPWVRFTPSPDLYDL